MILAALMRTLRIAALVTAWWVVHVPGALAQPSAEPVIVDAQIGFHGVYKLGCWTPLTVELMGQQHAYTGHVTVTVPDSDGVPTTVVSPRPVGIEPGQTTKTSLYVRVGQSNSALKIRFTADEKVRSERTFYASPQQGPGVVPGGVPATDRILLQFGPPLQLRELVRKQEGYEPTVRIARIESAEELPTSWIGYEGVETVLLTTSEPELYRPLLQNQVRLAALGEWVRQGGRLVVFCGAHGHELLSPQGPLEKLIPGTYAETLPLRQSQALENFCAAAQPVSRDRRLNLAVSRLQDVRGQILLDAGGRGSSLPLVVRAHMGLGELVFVGLDFDSPPLGDWSGRVSFLKSVLVWQDDETQDTSNSAAGYDGQSDLVTQLCVALDEKFVGVKFVSFGVVTVLVAAYLLLIGPGDYFLVKKALRRTELTWVTFPLIVIGASAGAYWFANRMKGDQLHVNQVEVVDIDTRTGQVRGTVWTHFFTPRVHAYNLTFEPVILGSLAAPESKKILSWLGKPGYSLGGMQAGGEQTSVFSSGYSYGAELDSLHDLPVQVWSTKTITARWSATCDINLESLLERDDEQLSGQFTNTSAVELADCQLLYGTEAYYLGRVPAGAPLRIDEAKLPRRVKTLLTNATAGESPQTQIADDGTVPFSRAKMDVARLAKVMMFYDAINGARYTGMVGHYQSFLDLSHLLEQNDLAILLCRVSAMGSRWIDDAEALGSDPDRRWTYYRFVLPVAKESRDSRR